MTRILTPKGELREIEKAVPVCEMRARFNERQVRIAEPAKNMKAMPTAVALKFRASQFPAAFGEMNGELFVGNLKPEKVLEIMRELLEEGYYDFSSMSYQKECGWEKTVLDDGVSEPYMSDYTDIFGSVFGGTESIFAGSRPWENGQKDMQVFDDDGEDYVEESDE